MTDFLYSCGAQGEGEQGSAGWPGTQEGGGGYVCVCAGGWGVRIGARDTLVEELTASCLGLDWLSLVV